MTNKSKNAANTKGTGTPNKKVTKPAAKTQTKPVKAPEKELEEVNKEATTQKVVINRELKYIYPKGMISTTERKAFRQKVRKKLERMEAKLAKLKGKERVAQKELIAEHKKEFYTQGAE